MKKVPSMQWAREWIEKAIHTEDYQRKHFDKFGYEALVEACRKYDAKVLIQPEIKSTLPKSKPSNNEMLSTKKVQSFGQRKAKQRKSKSIRLLGTSLKVNLAKEFEKWLSQNWGRFPVKLIRTNTKKGTSFYFYGIPCLSLRISNTSFAVVVYYKTRCIDFLTDFDLLPIRSKTGSLFCDLCKSNGQREQYKTLRELLETHSFEPFLHWCIENLKAGNSLVMQGDRGWSAASIYKETARPKPTRPERTHFFLVTPLKIGEMSLNRTQKNLLKKNQTLLSFCVDSKGNVSSRNNDSAINVADTLCGRAVKIDGAICVQIDLKNLSRLGLSLLRRSYPRILHSISENNPELSKDLVATAIFVFKDGKLIKEI